MIRKVFRCARARHIACIPPFSVRAAEGGKESDMNLVVWLPAMLLLGLAGMGLCLAFVIACEKI
jgi:hypothetical protein